MSQSRVRMPMPSLAAARSIEPAHGQLDLPPVTRSRRPARPDTVLFADALGGKNGHLGADAKLGCVQDPKMSGETAARGEAADQTVRRATGL
jgi:hypothetical protein